MQKEPEDRQLTQLLIDWSRGDESALRAIAPLVYDELRRIARRRLRSDRVRSSLQSAELANEAYLKLVDHERMSWQSRAHFFAVASTIMRRLLVDHARRRQALKRGGGAAQAPFDETLDAAPGKGVDLIALDDALFSLAVRDPRKSRVVELRFFGGLNAEEAACVLGISRATVEREWSAARAWLYRELRG